MYKLSQLQELALPAVKWLIDDSQEAKGSGRTELLAYAYLMQAIESGKKVFPNDVSYWANTADTMRARQNILRRIVELADQFSREYPDKPGLKITVYNIDSAFKIEKV